MQKNFSSFEEAVSSNLAGDELFVPLKDLDGDSVTSTFFFDCEALQFESGKD